MEDFVHVPLSILYSCVSDMNENVTSIHVTTVETIYQNKISYVNTVKPTFEVSMVKGRLEHGAEGNPKWRLCILEVTEH